MKCYCPCTSFNDSTILDSHILPVARRTNIRVGSFLVSVHEKGSLAAAIAYHFEKQAEGAPDGATLRATPSLEGIRGTLQACSDQTSAFNWRNLLSAIDATLDIPENQMYGSVTFISFRETF
jgi:hypothetical protein